MKLRLPWQKKVQKLDLIANVHTDAQARRFGEPHWREGRYGHDFRTCSYCGSIHPEDLVKMEGWFASWADQKYGYPHKFYVEGYANPEPNRLFVMGSANHRPSKLLEGDMIWVDASKLSREQRRTARAEGYFDRPAGMKTPEWLAFGHRSKLHAKFYTEHYSDSGISDEIKDAIMRRSGLWMSFSGAELLWHNYWKHFPEKDPGLEVRIATCPAINLAHKFPYSRCACGWGVTPENRASWVPEELA